MLSPLDGTKFIVYGGTGHHVFDNGVLTLVNNVLNPMPRLAFTHVWHQDFPDDEPSFLLEKSKEIAGRNVVIFSCPINHQLEIEVRDMIVASKYQYHAKSVTVVMSFLRYRRQDHDEKEDEITRLRWFIKALRDAGADRLIVCDPHSVSRTRMYCEEFGVALSIVDPTRLFASNISGLVQTLGPENVKVYSPDLGSVSRAATLAAAIGVGVIATPKTRLFGDKIIAHETFDEESWLEEIHKTFPEVNTPIDCRITDLNGLHIFMREDELSTGSTACDISPLLRKAGARGVRLIVTHPVCTKGWKMKLFPRDKPRPFDNVWFGNTRPRGEGWSTYRESSGGAVTTVDLAPAVADVLIKVLEEIDAGGWPIV